MNWTLTELRTGTIQSIWRREFTKLKKCLRCGEYTSDWKNHLKACHPGTPLKMKGFFEDRYMCRRCRTSYFKPNEEAQCRQHVEDHVFPVDGLYKSPSKRAHTDDRQISRVFPYEDDKKYKVEPRTSHKKKKEKLQYRYVENDRIPEEFRGSEPVYIKQVLIEGYGWFDC